MGYHQERKWWGGRIATIFGNGGFSRLSSCETEPLLGSNNDFCANHQQDIGERQQYLFLNGDYEEICKSICELQRKMDELRRKMDEVKIENEKHDKTEKEKIKRATATLEGEIRKIKDRIAVLEGKLVNKSNEKHDKTEKEKIKRATANLEGEIIKITDRIALLEGKLVNKIKDTKKIAEIEIRNTALEGEIKKLKARFIYLEVNSILNVPGEHDSSASLSSLDQMEEMERPASYDELFTWIIILAFSVGFLIGMQI